MSEGGQPKNTREPRIAVPRVLSIAGTDPTGGAGIQADLKSIAANGGYGMAAVTALVAQNTRGVVSVHTPPVEFLREQLDSVRSDVTIDAIKLGMLASAHIIQTIRVWLSEPWHGLRPTLVLDPVMVATSGDRLLDSDAESALRSLITLVDVVTPNIPELAILVEQEVATDWAAALQQGHTLANLSGARVLVKGGHLTGHICRDAIIAPGHDQAVIVESVRIETDNTHGTGCSMSSALATLYPRYRDWSEVLRRATGWMQDSLAYADELDVGHGHGPINHFHSLWRSSVTNRPDSPALPAQEAIEVTQRQAR